MTVLVSKLVRNMHVRCSFVTRDGAEAQRKSGGAAASDTCQGHATTAVELPNGARMYRCEEHKGLIKATYGPIWETVQVREENQ